MLPSIPFYYRARKSLTETKEQTSLLSIHCIFPNFMKTIAKTVTWAILQMVCLSQFCCRCYFHLLHHLHRHHPVGLWAHTVLYQGAKEFRQHSSIGAISNPGSEENPQGVIRPLSGHLQWVPFHPPQRLPLKECTTRKCHPWTRSSQRHRRKEDRSSELHTTWSWQKLVLLTEALSSFSFFILS